MYTIHQDGKVETNQPGAEKDILNVASMMALMEYGAGTLSDVLFEGERQDFNVGRVKVFRIIFYVPNHQKTDQRTEEPPLKSA